MQPLTGLMFGIALQNLTQRPSPTSTLNLVGLFFFLGTRGRGEGEGGYVMRLHRRSSISHNLVGFFFFLVLMYILCMEPRKKVI